MIRRLLRLAGFEWRKLLARRLPLVAFGVVVLIALGAPAAGRVVDTAASLVRGKAPAQDPFQNGWTALVAGVGAARLFLALVLLVLAGSSVAEEQSQGTLQALLVRPVRRTEVLIAKALALWSYAAVLLVVAVAAAALGAALTHGLYDVVDPFYPDHLVHAFGTMAGYVYLATGLTLLPLAALTALGLLCSVLLEHPGYATGAAIGLLFLLSAASGLSQDAGRALPVSYLAAPFAAVGDLAGQYSGASRRLAPAALAWACAVPTLWALGLFGVGAVVLGRRDVARG